MIENKDVLNINYYNYKKNFFGSYKNMRYKIIKKIIENDIEKLEVCIWKGPYAFEYTSDDEKEYELFEFSKDGLEKVVEYLNDKYNNIYNL